MADFFQDQIAFQEFAQLLFSAPTLERALTDAQSARGDRPEAGAVSPRALVVEDVDYHLDRLASMLRLIGFDTLTAASGGEALRVLTLHEPRIVLLDWVLPDTNALMLTQAIRRLRIVQPVIVGTATLLSDEIRELALCAGIDAFCDKPVALPALVACLKARGLLGQDAEIDGAESCPDFEDVRRLSRGSTGRPCDFYRTFICDLLEESQRIVDLARTGRLDELGECAEKLLWRASLIGKAEFVDVVRAIRRAASSGQGPVVQELAHALEVEARALAHLLEHALCGEKLPV